MGQCKSKESKSRQRSVVTVPPNSQTQVQLQGQQSTTLQVQNQSQGEVRVSAPAATNQGPKVHDRVLHTETKFVDGQPLTRSFVRTRESHVDSTSGKTVENVTEELIPMEEANKRVLELQNNFRAMNEETQRMHNGVLEDLHRLHNELMRLWNASLESDRVLHTETNFVQGKTTTRSLVKTRDHYMDPSSGKVIEKVSEQEIPNDQAYREVTETDNHFRAMNEEAQKMHLQMQAEMHRVHQDMAKIWKASAAGPATIAQPAQ